MRLSEFNFFDFFLSIQKNILDTFLYEAPTGYSLKNKETVFFAKKNLYFNSEVLVKKDQKIDNSLIFAKEEDVIHFSEQLEFINDFRTYVYFNSLLSFFLVDMLCKIWNKAFIAAFAKTEFHNKKYYEKEHYFSGQFSTVLGNNTNSFSKIHNFIGGVFIPKNNQNLAFHKVFLSEETFLNFFFLEMLVLDYQNNLLDFQEIKNSNELAAKAALILMRGEEVSVLQNLLKNIVKNDVSVWNIVFGKRHQMLQNIINWFFQYLHKLINKDINQNWQEVGFLSIAKAKNLKPFLPIKPFISLVPQKEYSFLPVLVGENSKNYFEFSWPVRLDFLEGENLDSLYEKSEWMSTGFLKTSLERNSLFHKIYYEINSQLNFFVKRNYPEADQLFITKIFNV